MTIVGEINPEDDIAFEAFVWWYMYIPNLAIILMIVSKLLTSFVYNISPLQENNHHRKKITSEQYTPGSKIERVYKVVFVCTNCVPIRNNIQLHGSRDVWLVTEKYKSCQPFYSLKVFISEKYFLFSYELNALFSYKNF